VGSDPNRDVVTSDSTRRIAVLISGRGSNLQALIDAIGDGRLRAEIAVVISNRPEAQGLARAQAAGIPAATIDHRAFATRELFERALVAELQMHRVSLVCLAGFMRLLGQTFLAAYPNAILNIHPSLLPAFPGVNAAEQALTHGVKIAGVTVHLVTGELDGGPIVAQAAVPVQDDDTAESLAARILIEEHRIYPEAVSRVLDRGWAIEGRRFVRQQSPHV
jgi:phosphoribosylglycinamide formyltransferase 1